MGALTVLAFGGLGLVTVAVWWRMRTRDRETLAQWDAREAELEGEPDAFNWEEHVDDSDAWKGGDDDSEP